MTITQSTAAARTAGTARIVLGAGLVFALEALWRGSTARALIAAAVLVAGAGLLVFARRTG
jgi:hypothetical protein